MKLLGLGLIVVLAISIFRNYYIRKDIRSIEAQLRDIRETYNMGKLTSLNSSEDLNGLVREVNVFLRDLEAYKVASIKRDQEVKDIIASISHDLKTPLTSIKGYTDLLLKDRPEGRDREYLEIIKERSESLNSLIYSFYELSKLELKEYDYKLDYVNLNDLLVQSLVGFYDGFIERGIRPEIDIDSQEIMVLGDPRAIERVFINLVDNGLKYSLEDFKVSLRLEDGKIVNTFSNRVDSLSEDEGKKLFNKFYTLETSRQSESTGLGLYITEKILGDLGYGIDIKVGDNTIEFSIDWNKIRT